MLVAGSQTKTRSGSHWPAWRRSSLAGQSPTKSGTAKGFFAGMTVDHRWSMQAKTQWQRQTTVKRLKPSLTWPRL